MEEIIIHNEGLCPICGKFNDFTCDGSEIDGDSLYYKNKCNNCGAVCYERYMLQYHSTTGIMAVE